MRTIGVVTVARSDYGIYRPVLDAIKAVTSLDLKLFVAGAHLSSQFGMTVRMIEADGFTVTERIPTVQSTDSPVGIAMAMGAGLAGFARAFERCRPDLLVVLGDRFEMFAAAAAALPFVIPVAHIHGGEVTHGAIDDAIRHSITKMSHLHFVSTDEYRRRVAQLGEEPWRIVVVGAPALDQLRSMKLLTSAELHARFGISVDRPPLLVTFHPTTLEYGRTEHQVTELLAALDRANLPIVFTQPNADTLGLSIDATIRTFVRGHAQSKIVDTLGTEGYFSLMNLASAMVGNSSSGLLEAPSFGLPVVNIGSRQSGRVRAANVIDAANDRFAILRAIQRATQPAFRASLRGMANPYDQGGAAAGIVDRLAGVALDEPLTMKRFVDSPSRDSQAHPW